MHCSLSKSVTYSNLTTSSRQAKSLSNISCETTYSNRSKAKTIYHLGASKEVAQSHIQTLRRKELVGLSRMMNSFHVFNTQAAKTLLALRRILV